MLRKSVHSDVTVGDIINQLRVVQIHVNYVNVPLTYKDIIVILECTVCGNETKCIRTCIKRVRCSTMGCLSRYRGTVKCGDSIGKLTVLSITYDDIVQKYNHICECSCGDVSLYTKLTRRRSAECNTCSIKTVSYNNIIPNNGASVNRLFGKYKNRATKKGYGFFLTKPEFIELIFTNCTYCDDSPSPDHEGCLRNGIDRIDSTIGYTLSNSVACCGICNRAKSDLPLAAFMVWISRITHHNMLGLNNLKP